MLYQSERYRKVLKINQLSGLLWQRVDLRRCPSGYVEDRKGSGEQGQPWS